MATAWREPVRLLAGLGFIRRLTLVVLAVISVNFAHPGSAMANTKSG
jgi:hypothetical protein